MCRWSRHRSLPSRLLVGYNRARQSAWCARLAQKRRQDRRPRRRRQVSDFLVRLFTLSNPDQAPGSPTTVRELLERGAGTIETDLKEQPAVQANLFGTLSKVYEALGQYPQSKRFAEKSLALPRATGRDGELQTATVLLQLGRAHQRLGDMEQTRTLIRAGSRRAHPGARREQSGCGPSAEQPGRAARADGALRRSHCGSRARVGDSAAGRGSHAYRRRSQPARAGHRAGSQRQCRGRAGTCSGKRRRSSRRTTGPSIRLPPPACRTSRCRFGR